MAIEIERKFFVDVSKLGPLPEGSRIVQGYVPTTNKVAVRARVKGASAFLTLKGESKGSSRLEFEYPIPLNDAELIISELCQAAKIDKTRYEITHEGHLWELDVFHGENDGLVVAEVELEDESEEVVIPTWVQKEVTGQLEYLNSSLINAPYKSWKSA
jgi:adenylate cyclase